MTSKWHGDRWISQFNLGPDKPPVPEISTDMKERLQQIVGELGSPLAP